MRPTPTFLGPRPRPSSSSGSSDPSNPPAASSPLAHLTSIDLLPFSIAHDGPAPVSGYFHPTPRAPPGASHPSPSPSPSAAALVPLQAAFRGRLVCSTPLPLPAGYTGLVFSTTAPAPTLPPPVIAASKRPAPASASASSRPAKRLSLAAGARGVAGGSRRSPRKAVRAAYKLDSDESDEEEEELVVKQEEEGRAEVRIEIEETVVEEAVGPVAVAPISLSANPSLLVEPPSSPPPKPATEAEAKQGDAAAEESDLLERDVKYLVPVATFGGLQVWNADYAPTSLEEDVFAKGVGEWIRVAGMVSQVLIGLGLIWRAQGRDADSCCPAARYRTGARLLIRSFA